MEDGLSMTVDVSREIVELVDICGSAGFRIDRPQSPSRQPSVRPRAFRKTTLKQETQSRIHEKAEKIIRSGSLIQPIQCNARQFTSGKRGDCRSRGMADPSQKGPAVPAVLIFFALFFSLEVVARYTSFHLLYPQKTSDMAAERLRSFAAQILPAGQKTGIEAMSVLPR